MTDPIEESRIFAECYPALKRFAAVVGPTEWMSRWRISAAPSSISPRTNVALRDPPHRVEPLAARWPFDSVAEGARPYSWVWDAAWRPDGARLATSCRTHVEVWDTTTGDSSCLRSRATSRRPSSVEG